MEFYKKQIEYYNCTAYKILSDEIGLILPTFPTDKRPKGDAILASVLEGIASSVIGLAYQGISSFLHHKTHKALHKAVKVMERKTGHTVQPNTSFGRQYDYVWCLQFRHIDRTNTYGA